MKIVYIHGANSTLRSFKYIQRHLPPHEKLNISYSVDTALIDNISNIENQIKENIGIEKFSIIGHSLGGVIAVALHHKFNNLDKTFTMSSPFGGSKFIEYLRWVCPSYRLFSDLKTTSTVIKSIKKTKLNKPFMSIVTSGGGNPLFGEPNDGTVTVKSQIALSGPKYIYYDLQHFEVLLSDRVIQDIKDFIFSETDVE